MASGHTATREQRARDIRVWDLPTRLFHWALVLLVAVAIVSGKAGALSIHMLAGETILGLVLFRLVWGLVGSQTARFTDFIRGPRAVLAYLTNSRTPGAAPVTLGHNPLGGLMVVALLLVLLVQASSGLFTTDDVVVDGPLVPLVAEGTVKALSTLHRLLPNGLLLMIAVHVAAVLVYLLVKKDNLIGPMITGRKRVPHALGEPPVDEPRRASPLLALTLLLAALGLVSLVVRAAG
ncbi:cytochrome b/b6 domain-containing protein [Azospirillum griseum]|uniref:Cytochrome B n=1 Tax=Azospirillum griseum TaxID=2496639 RepID=A0A3S0RCH0_9PROT|nr:cytochrome b/b6 domain-containing protein [Azospirillum griseum]RTR24571.1 cytochrome B [Azospirillum griseum]